MLNKLETLRDNNVVRLLWTPRSHDKKQICFYLNEKGKSPVLAWMCSYAGCRTEEEFANVIGSSSGKGNQESTLIIRKLVYYLRERIATRQLPKSPENYRPLKQIGCWEVKHETGRLIGFYDGDIFVVVHGFEKKTNKQTPQRHLDTTKDRKVDYERRKNKIVV